MWQLFSCSIERQCQLCGICVLSQQIEVWDHCSQFKCLFLWFARYVSGTSTKYNLLKLLVKLGVEITQPNMAVFLRQLYFLTSKWESTNWNSNFGNVHDKPGLRRNIISINKEHTIFDILPTIGGALRRLQSPSSMAIICTQAVRHMTAIPPSANGLDIPQPRAKPPQCKQQYQPVTCNNLKLTNL